MGPAWVCMMSSVYILWLLNWCSVGLLIVGATVSDSLLVLENLFLLLGCFVQPQCEVLALSYCIFFCPVWLSFFGGLLISVEEIESEQILGEWRWWNGLGKAEGEAVVQDSIFN